MSAQLLPIQQAKQPSPTAMADVRPAGTAHPLQARLRDQVCEDGERLIHRFIEETDSALQGLLAESQHAVETTALIALGHALTMNRPALARGFMVALQRRFDPLAFDASAKAFDPTRLARMPSEELEEAVSLTHLAQRAEALAGEDGRQVLARLQWAARSLGLPALTEALAPQTLPDCFAAAFRKAGLDAASRVLAYRLVESHALKAWPELITQTLALLDRLGLKVARPLSAGGGEHVPTVSEATRRALLAAHDSATDRALARTLLQAVEPPVGAHPAGLLTALAGRWVDSLLATAELPAGFAADLEGLRWVILKAVVADPGFLVQPMHPVRRAVDELAQKAAFTALQGFSLVTLREEVHAVAARVSVHGQFALDALTMLPPMEPGLSHRFHQRLAKEQEARRESLLVRVRALATREIEARTLDLSLPAAARMALARGFLPLLTTSLLRHGGGAPATRQVRQLLERFVDSFSLFADETERQEVLTALAALLGATGFARAEIETVSAELRQVYAALDAEAKAADPKTPSVPDISVAEALAWIEQGPPTVDETSKPVSLTQGRASNDLARTGVEANPLGVLLRAGQWFRVRDYKRGDDRWLSLTSVHLEQDGLAFSGFDGVAALTMRASQFVEDLCSGMAEPLNPEPRQLHALEQLRSQSELAVLRLRKAS